MRILRQCREWWRYRQTARIWKHLSDEGELTRLMHLKLLLKTLD